jgi:hypothetical protein
MRKLVFAIAALLLVAAGYLIAQPTEPAGHAVMTPDGKIIIKGAPETPKSLPPLPPLASGTVVPLDGQLSLRIEGEYQGKVVGTLMVNHNGRWSEVILGGNKYVR